MNVSQLMSTTCIALSTLFYCKPGAASSNPDDDSGSSDYKLSSTIRKSQRHHRFIQEVLVSPSKFMWEGHDLFVYESWMERADSGNQYLIFKLKVDNQVMMDQRIMNREDKIFAFQVVGAEHTLTKGYIDDFKKISKKHFARYFANGMTGESVYYFLVKNQRTERLSVRVVTIYSHPNKITSTGQVIEFDLSPSP